MLRRSIRRTLPGAFVLALTACQPSAPPPPTALSEPVATSPAAASTVAPVKAVESPPPSSPPDVLDAGVVGGGDTLDDLQKRFGSTNVKATNVPGAEGEEFPGWILYPDDPKRRVYIYLDDAGKHPSLARVLDAESQWRRRDAIHMGMTLKDLVAINGKPIQFSGFGWDYGGAITDMHHGALEKQLLPGGLSLCPPSFPDDKYPDKYPTGDAQFSSDNALAVRYPPVVCEFGLSLDVVKKQP